MSWYVLVLSCLSLTSDKFSKTFLRPFSPSEIERFAFYARRVRRLNVSLYIHEAVLLVDQLAQTSPPHSHSFIFPNLRELTLYDYPTEPGWCDRARMFLCPRIERFTTLVFEQSLRGPEMADFLRQLPTTCPSLRRLELGGIRGSEALVDSLSLAVGQSNLVCLDLKGSSPKAEVIPCISNFPDLEVLRMQDDYGSALGLLDHDSFGKLRELELTSNYYGSCAFFGPRYRALNVITLTGASEQCRAMLRAVELSPLTSVCLAITDTQGPPFHREIIQTLSRWKTLQSLVLRDKCCSDPSPLTFQDLHPLLPLRHLQSLTLEVCGGLEIHDPVLADMASCWPFLSQLSLRPAPSPSQESSDALHLCQCNDLQTLRIALDASKAPLSLK